MKDTYSEKKALLLLAFPALFANLFLISAVLCLLIPDFCMKMLYLSEFLASSACKLLLVGIVSGAFLDISSLR